MRVLFITNIPSPYRIDFFNELGKNCELTVCFERHRATDRDDKWVGCTEINYREVYANVRPLSTDRSIGLGIAKVIKAENFDCLIISGYASPSVMCAITYCIVKNIPYYIESDGGFNRKDKFPKNLLKKFLLNGAKAHFTTCDEHTQYLLSIGILQKNIYKYPFSSVAEKDILKRPLCKEEKRMLRNKLSISEDKVIISVGQFIHRKGYDVLLEAVKNISKDIGVYIIGGNPTEGYLKYKNENDIQNVYFVDFMTKKNLKEWYMAADCFILPTREDVWGLVINEAMAYGLPIITTDKCIAGSELVKEGQNGYIVKADDAEEMRIAINKVMHWDYNKAGRESLNIIHNYTIERMAKYHLDKLE